MVGDVEAEILDEDRIDVARPVGTDVGENRTDVAESECGAHS